MIALEFNGVETDYCASCKGVWLDRGELGLVLGRLPDPPSTGGGDLVTGARRCPHCGRRMLEINLEGSTVTADCCTHGHGIWLDNGELQTIIRDGGGPKAAALADYCERVFGHKGNEGDVK
jgi:Zn-finger nucleic acid-binding protein